jgi:hypothetical protein
MQTGTYRPPRQPRYQPTGALKKATASSIRKLSADLRTRHPDLGASEHLDDAAKALDRNQHDAAQRHLRAAIENFTPSSLRRHGLLTDDQHDDGKRSMDAVHRHLLMVKDIQDLHEQNQQLPHAADTEDDDLTVKPTARQPDGQRAMNTPDAVPAGRIDINVTQPQKTTDPKEAKQVAASTTSGDLTTAIELAFDPSQPRDHKGMWTRLAEAAKPFLESPLAANERAISQSPGTRLDDISQFGPDHMDAAHPGIEKSQHAHVMDHLSNPAAQSHTHKFLEALRERRGALPPMPNAPPGQFAPVTPRMRADMKAYQAVQRQRTKSMRNAGVSAREAQIQMDYSNVDLGHHYDPSEPRGKHGEWSDKEVEKSTKKLVRKLTKGATPHTMKQIRERERDSSRSPVGREDIKMLAKIIGGKTITAATPMDFSVKTGALASTPHPFGKPGGPGLWHQKDMELPPYIQNIARAILREGRAKDLSSAIAIAKASTSKWANTSKHPEVRAASAATNADWDAKRARAHAHSSLLAAIELASSGGHHIAGTPDTYKHGWLKIAGAQPKGVNADNPTADKMHVGDLRAHLNSMHSGLPAIGRASKPVTGKKNLVALHESMHQAMDEASRNGRPRPVTKDGTLVDWGLAHTHGMSPSSALARELNTEYAAEGDATKRPDVQKLNLVQREEYVRQVTRGAGHAAALKAARAVRSPFITQTANQHLASRVIELVGTAAGAAKDTHVAAGSAAGGQFGAAGGGGAGSNTKASQKAALLKRAAALRAQAAAAARKLALLKKALKGTTAKQAGAVTAAKKAVTPAAAAKAAAAKTPAGVAAAAKAKAATAATPAGQASALVTAAGKAVTPAQIAAVQRRMSQAQIKVQIAALTKQVTSLLTQAAALTKQAASL